MYIPPTKLWNGFKQNERLQTKVNNNTAGIWSFRIVNNPPT
jgi:hypothetical protein